jgi:hypothetical protein
MFSTKRLPKQKLHIFQLSVTMHYFRTVLNGGSVAPFSPVSVTVMLLLSRKLKSTTLG